MTTITSTPATLDDVKARFDRLQDLHETLKTDIEAALAGPPENEDEPAEFDPDTNEQVFPDVGLNEELTGQCHEGLAYVTKAGHHLATVQSSLGLQSKNVEEMMIELNKAEVALSMADDETEEARNQKST